MTTRSRKRRPAGSPQLENDENDRHISNSLPNEQKGGSKKGFVRKRSRVIDDETTDTSFSSTDMKQQKNLVEKEAPGRVCIEELPEGSWRPEGEKELLRTHEQTVVMDTEQLRALGVFTNDQGDCSQSVAKQCVVTLRAYEFTPVQEQWSTLYAAITQLRRLAICHPSIVDATTAAAVMDPICSAAQNLRSSIVRNALLCIKELFESVDATIMAPHTMMAVHCLIAITVLSDKRFVKELAAQAATAVVASVPSAVLLAVLLPFGTDDNRSTGVGAFTSAHPSVPLAAAVAHVAILTERTLAKAGIGQHVDAGLDVKALLGTGARDIVPLVMLLSQFLLVAKTVDGKEAARKSCRRLRRALGKTKFESVVHTALNSTYGQQEQQFDGTSDSPASSKELWHVQQMLKAAEPKHKKKTPALSLRARMALTQQQK